jgi:hypothetical protein
MASSAQSPMPVPQKNTSPVVWIIVGILGLVMVAGVVIIAGGLFVAKRVSDAASNPALTTAKIMAAANPDLQIISSDDRNGTVTFKDKKSGRVVTLNFDQIKQGRITFEEDGKKVSVDSSGGGINVARNDGSTVQIGPNASSKLPDWLPAYPGSSPQGTFAMQGANESNASVTFTTKDPVDKISKFYDETLRKAGLTTTVNLMQQDGKTSGAMIAAESVDKKRSAVINIAAAEDEVTVGITYAGKN